MTETGIKRTEEGGIFCEACGNDLSKDGAATFCSHLDGDTFFINQFTCNKCGATLSQTHQRSKEDAAWWKDPPEEEAENETDI